MIKDFYKIMANHTDAELLKIVGDLRLEYQPEAVTAAENELKSRNLSSAQIEEAQIATTNVQQFENEKSQKPLPMVWKIITVIKPGLIQFIVAAILKEKGYRKMSKDLFFWNLMGIAIIASIIITLKFISSFL